MAVAPIFNTPSSGGYGYGDQGSAQQGAPDLSLLSSLMNPGSQLGMTPSTGLSSNSWGGTPSGDTNTGGSPSLLTSLSMGMAPPSPGVQAAPPPENAGDLGHMGNVALPTIPSSNGGQSDSMAFTPFGQYQRQVGASNDRINQGDTMIANAYKQPLPPYQGPQFGTADLIGGLLPALLMLSHKQGFPAPGLQFAESYLGGKQDIAKQAYQRQIEQFMHGQQAQVQAGQAMSNQGIRGGQQAEMAYHYGVMGQSADENALQRLQAQLQKDSNVSPAAVPGLATQANDIYSRLGHPEPLFSPDDIKAIQGARQTQLDWNNDKANVSQTLKGFMQARTQIQLQTMSSALQAYAQKYPDRLPEMGLSSDSIQDMIKNQVPAWEAAQQATARYRNSMAALNGSKKETLDDIRDPTIESMQAGTWQKHMAGMKAMMDSHLSDVRAEILPKQVAAQSRQADAAVQNAESRSRTADQQIKSMLLTDALKGAQAGSPTPNTLASLSGKAQGLATTYGAQASAYAAKALNISQQADAVRSYVQWQQAGSNGKPPNDVAAQLQPGQDPQIILQHLSNLWAQYDAKRTDATKKASAMSQQATTWQRQLGDLRTKMQGAAIGALRTQQPAGSPRMKLSSGNAAVVVQ